MTSAIPFLSYAKSIASRTFWFLNVAFFWLKRKKYMRGSNFVLNSSGLFFLYLSTNSEVKITRSA